MNTSSTNHSKYIALDVGTERIGVATSNPEGTIAMPHETLAADKEIFGELRKLVESREPEKIIVGWPLHMDGSKGAATSRTDEFIDQLEKALNELEFHPPVERVDERLSTSAASDVLNDAGMTKKGRNQAVDKLAATRILKTFIERNDNSPHA